MTLLYEPKISTGAPVFSEYGNQITFILAIIGGQRPSFYPASREGRDFTPLWTLAASCWAEALELRPSADEVVELMRAEGTVDTHSSGQVVILREETARLAQSEVCHSVSGRTALMSTFRILLSAT